MAKELKLNANDILDKQFHVDFKGYNAHEVDEFLDLVLNDYKAYDEIANGLKGQISQLELNIASLKARILELEGEKAIAQSGDEERVSQVDIIQRLAKLEKIVYSNERD